MDFGILPGWYVDRGDPDSWDFMLADLTTDESWHVLDLSSIIPSNATAVHLGVEINSVTKEKVIEFRQKGNMNVINTYGEKTIWDGTDKYGDGFVAIDESGLIEYCINDTPWNKIKIVVRGWIRR